MSASPPPVQVLDDRAVATLLPVRDPHGHKGTFGRLLVVAGSLDYSGAALLVSRAAGRAGAGLIRLAVPASLQPFIVGRFVEATTLGLPETETGIVDAPAALERLLAENHDALVVGPGLRAGPATVRLVEGLLAPEGHEAKLPAIVDAEAINSLATLDGWAARVRRPCVVTPHVAEFGRLRDGIGAPPRAGEDLVGDDDARTHAAAEAARGWGLVVVLKGAHTVIAARDGRIARAPFANPALASGGTGDVLSGTIGALLAQRLDPFEAACAGVYLHGLAGEAVSERLGDSGLLASDLPDEIARARHRLARLRSARSPVGFAIERSRGAAS